MLCDTNGFPVSFLLTPGQTSDSSQFISVLESVRLPWISGRPLKRCRFVVADKGYDSQSLRHYCSSKGVRPIIPYRRMRRTPRPGLPYQFDKPRYRQRNAVERLFGWLKEKRRINSRFDKLASSFNAMVTLACIGRCMRADFSDRT